MELTTFQNPQIRDSNDNIIQDGAYGKYTALTNVQNTGVFDYINNNLMYLYNSVKNIDVSWDSIEGKPTTFPPNEHNHDNLYYGKDESDALLGAKANASNVYTKTEVDNSLANYLPLSGGDLRGEVTVKTKKIALAEALSMPATSNAVEISCNLVAQNTSWNTAFEYTLPSDGWVEFACGSGANSNRSVLHLLDKGNVFWATRIATINIATDLNVYLPAKKGSIIKGEYVNIKSVQARFIPAMSEV